MSQWSLLTMATSGASLLVLASLVVMTGQAEAGCRGSGLCCAGKNISCRAVHTAHQNAIDSLASHHHKEKHELSGKRSCFCDEHCLHVGDCCEDYKEHCEAVDCLLGDWKVWGKCSKDCGWGSKERRRPIIVHPSNGGKKCESHVEKTFCYGQKCKTVRHSSSTLELRETAKVIPAMYGRWRKNKLYDPYSDIRRNLFHHYSANQIIQRPPSSVPGNGYCARFEISRAKGSCFRASNPWAQSFKKGHMVCVECQQLAMKRKLGVRCKGHGVYMKETRWNAITVPGCHGKWVMKSQHEECTCNPGSGDSFILI